MSLPGLQSKPLPILKSIINITADITLDVSQSEAIIKISQAATLTINIPNATVSAGVSYRFSTYGSANFTISITAPAQQINLVCITPTGDASAIDSNGGATGTTIGILGNAPDGTWIHIYSDGTSWNGVACSAVADILTLA
jgi:hypothetical protein